MVTEEAYATVVAENAQLKAQNAALQADLAAALQRIAVLEAQKRPPPAFVKANARARAPKERRKRAPEHNRARRLEPPTRVVEHRIERCPACPGRLSALPLARRRQVVDLLPPPPVEVSDHPVYQGGCSYCRQWRAAPLDLRAQGLGQGRLGVGIASVVAHLRTALRLPLRQIRAYLADLHGLQVSVGAVVERLHRVAQRGSTAVAHRLEQVQASTGVLGDETVWRENGRHGSIWLLAIPGGARYFAYRQSRAGAVVNDRLGEAFRGVLSSDCYAGSPRHARRAAPPRVRVHRLRDRHALKEGHADQPAVVAWATAVQALCERAKPLAQSPPLPAAVRHEPDEEWVAAAVALGARCAQATGHPCQALAQRLLRHQGELVPFVRGAGVPTDNHEAERLLRPRVVCRTSSGGSRNSRGSATRMALSSLVATWRPPGLNPLDECRQLLQRPLPQI